MPPITILTAKGRRQIQARHKPTKADLLMFVENCATMAKEGEEYLRAGVPTAYPLYTRAKAAGTLLTLIDQARALTGCLPAGLVLRDRSVPPSKDGSVIAVGPAEGYSLPIRAWRGDEGDE